MKHSGSVDNTMGRPPKIGLPAADATPKKDRLTLTQLAGYDDILTDALVDHVSVIQKSLAAPNPFLTR